MELIVNKEESVLCTVEHGLPQPSIKWIISNSTDLSTIKMITNDDDENIVNYRNELKILISNSSSAPSFTYISKIELFGSINLKEKYLICIVEHQLLDEPIIKFTKIDLKRKLAIRDFFCVKPT